MSFLSEYLGVIIFYTAIILLVFLNRKKFDMQGIIALYRTKIGLRSMNTIAKRYTKAIKILGNIGTLIGFIGLVLVTGFMIWNLFAVFIKNSPSAVSPVLPGLPIPGTGIKIPLISGWIALFLVVLIHEFSHGVVARAYNVEVKSSGIFFMGPLMGAFVEPEETVMKKEKPKVQYSILAAGPFSNVLLATISIILVLTLSTPIIGSFVNNDGFIIGQITEDSPAQKAQLQPNTIITKINDDIILDDQTLVNSIRKLSTDQEATILTKDINNNIQEIKLTPELKNDIPFLGVAGETHYTLKNNSIITNILYKSSKWIFGFLILLASLSLGIGLINLFPIFITDGARMLEVCLTTLSKSKGQKVWSGINKICLLILLVSIIVPLIK